MEVVERIVSGACALYMKFGVKSVTMDDIAANLGVSKKTIYNFFENKNDLVCEVMHFQLQQQVDSMEEIRRNAVDPVDETLKMGEFVRGQFQNMNASLLYEIEKYFPAAWKLFQEHKRHCIHDSIVRNLREGIEMGLYRKELNVEILAILRQEEIQLTFNPFIFPAPAFSFLEVNLQLIEHFLHGICTLKGHKLINQYKQINEEE